MNPLCIIDIEVVVEWFVTFVLKTEVLKGTVGSNPTTNVILRNGDDKMNINQNTNFGTHNTSVRPGKYITLVLLEMPRLT